MILQSWQKVFRHPLYIFLSITTTLVVFALAIWLPNISLIIKIMGHPGVSFVDKFKLPISLLSSITTNFTLLSASYTIAIAILFGLNISMLVYFLRKRVSEVKQNGITTSFLGITSGVIGMGCAACGSLLLSAVLSLFGASWFLSLLPFEGGEFGILGVILLALSIHAIAKQIQNPAVCKID